MRTKLALVLCFLALGLSACQKGRLVYDLSLEKDFAQKTGDVFIHDYMMEQEDDWRGWGWSRLRKEGTRLATYPSSRLRFIAEETIPLHLFCLCTPFMRDEVEAKSIRVQLNEKELATIELKKGISQLVDIVLPKEKIKRGNNWVEFFYIVDDEDSLKEPVTPDEKRKFSLVVYDLVLSSHPDLGFSKKYHQAWQSLKPEMKPGTIVQKVPSIMDFYLDIPRDAVLEARGTFYPMISGLASEDEISLDVSVQKPEREEEIIHTYPDMRAKDRISMDLPVSDKGIARLRLKAGDETKEGSLDGFLIWSDVRVIRQPKKGEPVASQDVLSRYRDRIADKNVVFFIFDAARADHFSAYGYFRPTTPHTDKFAQNSTVFTNAFSDAISTRCSVGTLFTGFPITVTSLTQITSGLPHELTTLAQLFQSHGFKTAGYTGVGNIGSVFGFDRGFDQYFELYKEEGFYRKSQQYLPYVIPWLEANKDRKFFLYIHFKEPHAVYKPLPPFHGMFSGAYEEKADLGKYHEMSQELSKSQVEYIRACYDENLASVDSVFGTIMDKLSDLGLDENTIVILTADHGDLLGENGRLFGHGDYFGEGVTHIPLFIRFPRQDEWDIPKKIGALAKLSDLFATLADGYRFGVPWHLIGGKSLLPVIAGVVQEVNPFVVVEKRDRKGFCIRGKQHKLILWEDAPLEFYDLADDPQAENNIYRREDVMAGYMLATLKKWIVTQEFIKEAVLGKDVLQKDIGYDRIDKETLENLKALGYIK